MRRILAGIAVVVAALVILYIVLRAASPGPERAGEPDTRCIAARIGLPCSS